MAEGDKRKMILVGFLQAQNCALLTSTWRQPATTLDFLTPRYYQRLATTLEDGFFHLAFFDDRLAMPDIYNRDHRLAVRNGIRPIKLDPIPIITVMAGVTRHLGLGATCSTTYHEPYNVARVFQTLDHMTGGRAAWNIVTSLNDSEAANFGRSEHLEHDLRYDRADEFVEAVLGHWNSWDDDALIFDREGGLFADPAKVRRLDYNGQFIKSRGPLTVPRSPQGHPVLIQAGQSGRGSEFAARWGELIFCVFPDLAIARRSYAKIKSQISEQGRDPDSVKVIPAFNVIVGPTRAAAEEKLDMVLRLTRDEDGFVLLSEAMDFDFGGKPPNEPLTDAELDSMNGIKAWRDRFVMQSGKTNPTPKELLAASKRNTIEALPLAIGSPSEVADTLEQWVAERGCDGFAIPGTVLPGTYEDFTRLVTPELQRRGLLHKRYAGPTLRENLGLPKAPNRAAV